MIIKLIHQDLLDEIIEKIGSKAIIECEPASIDNPVPADDEIDKVFDIQIDTNVVRAHYHKNYLYLYRGEDVIAIDRFRFFEVIIL